MKVLVLSVANESEAGGATGIDHCAWEKILQCARRDRFGEHELTDDPEEADIILFAEMGDPSVVGYFDSKVRRHPLMQGHPRKCFVLKSADVVLPYLPGIYASVERRSFDPRRARSGHYLSTHISEPPLRMRSPEERDLLYSFMGNAANHPVRQRLAALQHPRGLCRDVGSEGNLVWSRGPEEVDRFLAEYAEVMGRSRFALCPRGRGASSMRLFESMRAGVAPVIISDDWVPPTGPDWDAFSIRIPESQVDRIPEILSAREDESVGMGMAARDAWDEWFSDEVSFHRVVNWCAEIMESRQGGPDPWLGRLRAHLETLRPLHLRALSRDVRARRRRRREASGDRLMACESS